MVTKRGPSLGPDDKILDKFLPTTVVTQTELTAALDTFTPTTESANTPLYHFAVNGVYPGRPVTPRPVVWADPLVAVPAVAGSTTAGTGPAPIDTILYATGVGV